MRVALVSDWFLPRLGGIELHLRDLAGELSRRGHDVHVITTTPEEPGRQGRLQTDALPVREGVVLHRLDLALLPGAGLTLSPRAFEAADRVLRDIDPHVVHVHAGMVPPLALAAGRAASRAGVPVVATFHSLLGPVRPLWRLSERLLGWSRWADVLSGVGERVAREMERVVPDRGVGVLPNGIDPEAWRTPVSRPTDPGVLRLVAVMRLQRRKRGAALLRCVAAAAAELRDDPALSLTVIGDGPLRAALEDEAARLGISGGVDFQGYVPRPRLPERLADADVFLTAAVRESFGLSALEARCAGLAVVARRDSGVGDRMADGVEALLADGDEGLVAALVRLGRDRDLLRTMREHNRSTPTAYAWDVVVARHLEAYGDAVVASSGEG